MGERINSVRRAAAMKGRQVADCPKCGADALTDSTVPEGMFECVCCGEFFYPDPRRIERCEGR